MSLRLWLWTLLAALILLTLGHATANELGPRYLTTHFTAFTEAQSHTAASLWVRLASLPARLVLIIGLLTFLSRDRTDFPQATFLVEILLTISSFLTAFYTVDLLLDPSLGFTTEVRFLLSATTLAAALLTPYLIHRSGGGVITAIPPTLQLLMLSVCVHEAEAVAGSNNAFTIFAAQFIALIGATAWQKNPGSFLRFAQLAPALGYLFPITEKLLLNPVGWLSGRTWQAWAAYYGYTLTLHVSLAFTCAFLLFQGSMIVVLFRPKAALWLYPIAIGFHLISGLILGFGSALNPWIVALFLGWVLTVTIPTRTSSQLSSV